MLELCVVSGKGGVGKSLVASSLLLYLHRQGYKVVGVDADVDAPNLHLIFSIDSWVFTRDYAEGYVAKIDSTRCIRCGKCYEVCNFKAIKVVNSEYVVNEIICEGCYTCSLVCPVNAISRVGVVKGVIRLGSCRYGFPIVSAELRVGRSGSGKLVSELRSLAKELYGDRIYVIDSAAGIGCQVIASLVGVNVAIIVTEPTPAAFSDMKRIYAVTKHFNIPSALIINKYDINEELSKVIIDYARNEGIEVLGLLPYDDLVPTSLKYRRPIIDVFPTSKVSRALYRILEVIEEKYVKPYYRR